MILFENDEMEVICVFNEFFDVYDDCNLTGKWKIDQHNNMKFEVECSYTGKWMFFTKIQYTKLWFDEDDIKFIEKSQWAEFECSNKK